MKIKWYSNHLMDNIKYVPDLNKMLNFIKFLENHNLNLRFFPTKLWTVFKNMYFITKFTKKIMHISFAIFTFVTQHYVFLLIIYE